jgi:hypothetical protein
MSFCCARSCPSPLLVVARNPGCSEGFLLSTAKISYLADCLSPQPLLITAHCDWRPHLWHPSFLIGSLFPAPTALLCIAHGTTPQHNIPYQPWQRTCPTVLGAPAFLCTIPVFLSRIPLSKFPPST